MRQQEVKQGVFMHILWQLLTEFIEARTELQTEADSSASASSAPAKPSAPEQPATSESAKPAKCKWDLTMYNRVQAKNPDWDDKKIWVDVFIEERMVPKADTWGPVILGNSDELHPQFLNEWMHFGPDAHHTYQQM